MTYNFIESYLLDEVEITNSLVDTERSLDDTQNIDTVEEVRDVIDYVMGIKNGLNGVSDYVFVSPIF
jgi:hypothetical protein